MKKFMSLLLVGIMMLSLVACGKSGGGKGELNVGVFYYTYSDTYISSVRTALDNALTEAGIKFQNYDGNSNQTTQNEQIDTCLLYTSVPAGCGCPASYEHEWLRKRS